MDDFFSHFTGGQLIGLFSVVGGLLFLTTAVLAQQWRRVRVAELESALKQQMVEKGMAAAQMDQVLKAGHGWRGIPTTTPTGVEAFDRAALVQRMVDKGYDAEEIERVLLAYHQNPSKADDRVFMNRN